MSYSSLTLLPDMLCTSSPSPTFMLILLFILHLICSRSPRSPQTHSGLISPLLPSRICLSLHLISTFAPTAGKTLSVWEMACWYKFVSFKWKEKCAWQAVNDVSAVREERRKTEMMEKWWKVNRRNAGREMKESTAKYRPRDERNPVKMSQINSMRERRKTEGD